MPETTPTVRRRRLGAELRRLREAAGLTMDEAGKGLERAESTISRIENARNAIRPLDVRLLLDLYGVTDKRARAALEALARDSRKKGWWHTYADLLSPAYSDLISLEDDAEGVLTFELALVPGLLQTEDYARAVLTGGRMTAAAEEVETLVTVRMTRQAVLARPESPLRLWAIVSEAALRQQIGGPDVMRAQLRHLVEAADRPNVTLQVLPFSAEAHPGSNGPFVVFEFPESTALDVVLLENLTSSLYLEQEPEVRRYTLAYEHLRAIALAPADSRKLIARAAEET
ncbi:MAG: helix-turn-helix domain-containing protein [Streptomycetales bacterium]